MSLLDTYIIYPIKYLHGPSTTRELNTDDLGFIYKQLTFQRRFYLYRGVHFLPSRILIIKTKDTSPENNTFTTIV